MSSPNHPALMDEIWLEIFTYLPVKDRNNVRLTCRHFYELCNDSRLQQTEEIVFHGDLNTIAALNLLSLSRRLIQNIRFNYVINVTNDFFPFFDNHGRNIRSLIFQSCGFFSGSLAGIMERCTELRKIVLTLTSQLISSREVRSAINAIRVLNKNSMTFPQVLDLKLKLGRKYVLGWSDMLFVQFLALFPNVRKVDLDFPLKKITKPSTNLRKSSDKLLNTALTLTCIYNQMVMLKDQLEELRLYFHIKYNERLKFQPMEKFAQIEMKNLKVLSLEWTDFSDWRALNAKLSDSDTSDSDKSVSDKGYHITINSFLVYQNVTHIDCDFSRFYCISPDVTVRILLNTLTRLCSLRMRVCQFYMDNSFLETLVNSQLTKLEINEVFGIVALFNKSASDFNLQPNYRLKHLKISQDDDYDSLIPLFADYFRSLEHIVFYKVTEEQLLNIFEYQTNLRSLKLNNRHEDLVQYSKFIKYHEYQRCLKNADLSRHRTLPYLTHLHINEDQISLTNFLLAEFSFPRLKTLVVSIEHRGHQNDRFWQILATMKQLELIDIHFESNICFPQLLNVAQSLPKLRHISLRDKLTEVSPEEYLQLFSVCSSLRTLIHGSVKYFYDATTDDVKDIPDPELNDNPSNLCERRHLRSCEGIPHHYDYNNDCWDHEYD